jgi:hypothetical protein
MPFLPNIPQSTDQLSVSQGNILTNFSILGAIAGNTNPSSASINANSGFNWVYLPPQASNPPAGATFTAGNIGLYSSNTINSITGQNELYINKRNQGTVVQIPATASVLSVTSAPALNSNGWTYLPSGILMKWGFVQMNNSGAPFSVTFAAGANIPVFQQVFNIQLTQSYNSNTTSQNRVFAVSLLTPPTTIGFTMTYSGSFDTSTWIYYLAIGY